ncbi:MAG: methionyl-tRNA formyltransferase [Burkholderiaceae bacterium]|nr:methionyl-tRNA formyltransferase [Burkholderiaceae bacterium]
MRIVFAGTPVFAQRALEALLAAGHDVPLVMTQPDRPAGRGMKRMPSPVKQAALDAGIAVAQPRGLRLDGKYGEDAVHAQAQLAEVAPDVLVVAAYGLILPAWTLQCALRGCLNIHASLLPRWRGAAPIQRAIEAGDTETGITIMQMDEGLDTGDMLLRTIVPIRPDDTGASLHDVLAASGAEAILAALAQLAGAGLAATPQPATGVTYAAKLDKREAVLDFSQSADVLARRIRAFDPVPGATAVLPGLAEPVKIWRADSVSASTDAAPGTVLAASEAGIDLACGEGVLRVRELQRPGGRRQPVDVFIRSWSGTAG